MDSKEQSEIEARLYDVQSAHLLLKRAAEIRESKVPAATFEHVNPIPGAIGATAAYLYSGELLRMASNGLKELRARAHERLANNIFED